jgi:predicted nuclease with TOPRIM domain
MKDATTFSLKDLLNAYHEKCRELDHVRKIKDLLTDQNEKLQKQNDILIDNTLDSLHYETQITDLREELRESDLVIQDLQAECAELRQDLDREKSITLTAQAYRDALKYPSVDSNRFEPAYTGSYHVSWDDYKTGG